MSPEFQGDRVPELLEDGIQLLELASEAYELFREQRSEENRQLLNFMV
jgi:hypothetical protein